MKRSDVVTMAGFAPRDVVPVRSRRECSADGDRGEGVFVGVQAEWGHVATGRRGFEVVRLLSRSASASAEGSREAVPILEVGIGRR